MTVSALLAVMASVLLCAFGRAQTSEASYSIRQCACTFRTIFLDTTSS